MSDYGAETVYEAFCRSAERWPDNAMLCAPSMPGRDYHPDGIELTYADVRAATEEIRSRYAAAGYGPGHRVALLVGQRPEYFFHYLALNALGAAIVPVNPDYRHDEMLYQMAHSEADLAVGWRSTEPSSRAETGAPCRRSKRSCYRSPTRRFGIRRAHG